MTEDKFENFTITCTNPDKIKCKGRVDGYTQQVPIGMTVFETKCYYCKFIQEIDLNNYSEPSQPIFRVDK